MLHDKNILFVRVFKKFWFFGTLYYFVLSFAWIDFFSDRNFNCIFKCAYKLNGNSKRFLCWPLRKKKTAMLVSLISYVISFVFFSLASSFGFIFPALFFYALGDAFRTGTHKAIIFEWLKQNNRLSEKKLCLRIYPLMVKIRKCFFRYYSYLHSDLYAKLPLCFYLFYYSGSFGCVEYGNVP